MFRRNPDFIAVIVVALYLVLGNAGPAIEEASWLLPPGPELRDHVRMVVTTEIRQFLRELALSIHR